MGGDFQRRAARNDSREEAWEAVNRNEGQWEESQKDLHSISLKARALPQFRHLG